MEKMHSTVLVGLALLLVTSWTMGQRDDFDANVYMEKFGYLDDTPGHQHSPVSINRAVREFQRFHGLNPTGRLNRRTVRMMHRPRCGVPDVIKPGDRPLQLRGGPSNPMAPLAYNAPGYKWQNNEVTYKWVSFTNKVSRADQRRAIINAFNKWSAVTPLRFTQSTGNADILLSFGRRDHGDGRGNAFDGRSGTLAHAFFPGSAGLSGDTHFDDDENWSINSHSGTDLEIVAAHEFGHALGLGHSSVPSALMAPIYRGYDPNYQLHQDDISGVQSLYGVGSGGIATESTTPPTPTTRRPRRTRPPETTPTTDVNCNIRFQAVEQIQDGRILGFTGRYVHTISRHGLTNRLLSRRIFRGAPSNPGAVVYDRYNNHLYMFKGSRVWRFTNNRRDRGYPKRLPSDFHAVKGAMQWRDRGIYLFKGRNYMRWTENLRRNMGGYPRPIRTHWPRMPNNINAIFRSRDGYTYAFKGRRYYRYDYRARLAPGYPKDMRPVWLNCHNAPRMRGPQNLSEGDFSFLQQDYAPEPDDPSGRDA